MFNKKRTEQEDQTHYQKHVGNQFLGELVANKIASKVPEKYKKNTSGTDKVNNITDKARDYARKRFKSVNVPTVIK